MKVFFFHNHYIPSTMTNGTVTVKSVIVPEFYPDLNSLYLDCPCFFDTVESYIDYVIEKGYYPDNTPFAVENIAILRNHDIRKILQVYQNYGVKIIQIYCGTDNRFFTKNYGISSDGKILLKTMSELGIILDLSHIPDAYVKNIANFFEGQVVVSHCACSELYAKKITRSNSLNRDNILFLATRGAVFGISFLNDIISNTENNTNSHQIFDCILAQIRYFIDLIGTDSVALGPDYFDTNYYGQRFGISLKYPDALMGYQGLIHLAQILNDTLTNTDVLKILSTNVERVLRINDEISC